MEVDDGKSIERDIRSRVSKALDEGMLAPQAVAPFSVGGPSAIRWIVRAKIGELGARPARLPPPPPASTHVAFIVGPIEEGRDVTLNDRCLQRT
ncbi:transposase [Mesorhizobium escarrei]|uniref:Transposase n=1 Tax=Mesorhizobium escarrei TaxID=666018 RepID=A0ABM9DN71_9HYPH|nr:transposase [Mesorhizobium escarrei]